ncbi:MAG: VOC family protein [Opitutaceae bacterium]
MKIEHTAFNVAEPAAVASWFRDHLGMKIVRRMDTPPFMHFLADDSGNTLLEIYNNPPDEVPAYAEMNPLLFHLAFVSPDPVADRDRLVAAGAGFVDEVHTPAGDHLIMLRDPWGHCIQLCRRATPMLRET